MEYCRKIGVIPNFTLSGIDLTDDLAKKCAELVGALAVSVYPQDKNVGYDAVKTFVDLGLKQTNIHLMVSQETLPFVYEVLNDRLNDPRLSGMNAIVFLSVKPKGRAKNGYHSLGVSEYHDLIMHCFEHKIPIGFDSCAAPKFEAALESMKIPDEQKRLLRESSESCESTLFSSYINVDGEFWSCSFCEDEPGQKKVNVLEADDFLGSVWYHPSVISFRNKLISSAKDGCRRCPAFEINPENEDEDLQWICI
jgi:hypothetical protein